MQTLFVSYTEIYTEIHWLLLTGNHRHEAECFCLRYCDKGIVNSKLKEIMFCL